VQLNIETWRKHAPPGTEIIFVNDTNFRELVPDAPEEVFRMPYAAALSDIVRSAVLYHQGGLYMDTDFLVMGPLSDVFDKLDEGYDVVSYESGGGDGRPTSPSSECVSYGSFSSNFMAARKGNPVNKVWWENVKFKLTRLCALEEIDKERLCCHFPGVKDDRSGRCHVPWGYIEHLVRLDDHDTYPPGRRRYVPGREGKPLKKTPEKYLDAVERGNAPIIPKPEGTRQFCFRGDDSMAVHLNGGIYWQPWDSATGATGSASWWKSARYDKRFQCYDEDSSLRCPEGNWGKSQRTFNRFFHRIAYHVFFSTHRDTQVRSYKEVLNGAWLISELYRRSLKKKKKE